MHLRTFCSLDAERVKYLELAQTILTSTCGASKQVVHDMRAVSDALRLDVVRTGASNFACVDTDPVLHSSTVLFRLGVDVPVAVELATAAKLRVTTDGVWPIRDIRYTPCAIKATDTLAEIVGDVVISNTQYIDTHCGIYGRLAVSFPLVPGPVLAHFTATESIRSVNKIDWTAQLHSTATGLDAQRIRQLTPSAQSIKFNAGDLPIVRFACVNFGATSLRMSSVGQPMILFGLAPDTALSTFCRAVRPQILRQGLPGTPISFDNLSSNNRYGVIVVPYVEDL